MSAAAARLARVGNFIDSAAVLLNNRKAALPTQWRSGVRSSASVFNQRGFAGI